MSEPGKPRHLHPIAAAVASLRTVGGLLPLAVLALLAGEGDKLQQLAGTLLLLLPISLIQGVGSWLRFRYWVEGGELRVEEGLLVHKRTWVPRERIQAIDTSQGFLQRVFGLVRVQIKTAMTGTQVELSAVSRAEVQRLRALLLPAEARRGVSDRLAAATARHGLPLPRLLLAAATSGQLGVILSGLLYLYSRVDELIEPRLIRWLQAHPTLPEPDGAGPLVLVVFLLGGLLLAWLVSIGAMVLRYGGFSVERRHGDLVIARGVFERREVVIPAERVQAVRIVEGLLRQPLGFASLYVESAGHAEEKGQSTPLHPLLHRREWGPFLAELLPGFVPAEPALRPPPRALVRFLLKPGLLALAAGLALAAALPPYGALALFLLPVSLTLGLLAWRDTGLALGRRVAVVRSRWLERATTIVPRHRIQFAEVSSHWLQRRRRLVSCTLGVASGTGGAAYEARELGREAGPAMLDWLAPEAPPAEAGAAGARPLS